jgi:hypothetical protein
MRPARLLAVLSLLAWMLPVSAVPPQTLPLLTRLELDLRIDYPDQRLDGQAALTLQNTSDAPLSRVSLLLGRLMRVAAVAGEQGSLGFRQQVAVFEDASIHQVLAVDVELVEPLAPGASTRLLIDYGGHLVGYAETGMLYVQDRIAPEFTILREEAGAFPMPGVLSQARNRAASRAEFDFDVQIEVPDALTVALGGERVEHRIGDGRARFRYRSQAPALFVNIAIAPYQVLEDARLRLFHFPDDANGAGALLGAMQRASARFEAIFGPAAGEHRLHVMQIPPRHGSQASLAAGIILEAAAFHDTDHWQQAYHELSHLWNAPDLDGRHSPRWNEGLATFLQMRLARELDDWQGEVAARTRMAERLLGRCPADSACARVALRDYGREGLTDLAYPVGGLMFAALYEVLGEPDFDRALRRHYQHTREHGSRTDDLIAAFTEVGGGPAVRILADWLESTAWRERLAEAGAFGALVDAYRQHGR